jgi:hypothetical protein
MTCFQQRFTEHMHKSHGAPSTRDKLHGFMQRHGSHHFVILPVIILTDKSVALEIEKRVIHFTAAPLNTHRPVPFVHGQQLSRPAKRYRPVKRLRSVTKPNYTPPVYVKYLWHNTLYPTLTSVMCAVAECLRTRQATSTLLDEPILVLPGVVSLTKNLSVRSQFGQSLISVNGSVFTLSQWLVLFAQHPHVSSVSVLHVHHLVSTPITGPKQFLVQLLRHPAHVKQLYCCAPRVLVDLYQATHQFSKHDTATHLRQVLDRVFVHRFNVSLAFVPVFRVPLAVSVSNGALFRILCHVLRSCGFPHWLTHHLIGKAVISRTRAACNIGDMLCNYRHVARDHVQDHPLPCVCAAHPHLPRGTDGHVSVKCDESLSPFVLGRVLNLNLKHQPHMNVHDVQRSLQSALTALSSDLQPVLHRFSTAVGTPFMLSFLPCSTAVGIYDLRGHSLLSVPAAPNGPSSMGHPVTMDDVRQVQLLLHGLVVSPLDKDGGRAHLRCGHAWTRDYESLFLNDSHYSMSSLSVSEHLRAVQRTYSSICPALPFVVDSQGTVGTAYHLYKFKDVNKQRPIVPCFQLPLRRAFAAAGKALMLLVKRCKLMSFNITTPAQLQQKFASVPVTPDAVLVGFDVKNMYTELKHATALSSLRLFLDHLSSRGVRVVYVRKRGTRVVVSTHGNCGPKRYHALTLHQLYELAKLEMESMAFLCSGSLLVQTTGLAMGGYCSPGLAVILCIIHEYMWLSCCPVKPIPLLGGRYVDDVTLLLMSGAHDGWPLVQNFLSRCLPPECELELEQPPSDTVNMLECTLRVTADGVVFAHRNKNDGCWFTGVQRYRKFVHYSSAHPPRVLIGVIVGTFHRVLTNTTAGHPVDCLSACLGYVVELLQLGYPAWVLRQAVRRVRTQHLDRARQCTWDLCCHGIVLVLRMSHS